MTIIKQFNRIIAVFGMTWIFCLPLVLSAQTEIVLDPAGWVTLPGFVPQNPDPQPFVEKHSAGLMFSLSQQGKAMRWEAPLAPFKASRYLIFRFQADGIDTTSQGGYIIYIWTSDNKGHTLVYALQLPKAMSIGKDNSQEIVVDLFEKFKLTADLQITRLLVGFQAAAPEARLIIKSLVFSNDPKISAKPITSAANKAAQQSDGRSDGDSPGQEKEDKSKRTRSAAANFKGPLLIAETKGAGNYTESAYYSNTRSGVLLINTKGFENDTVRGDGLDPAEDENLLVNGGFEYGSREKGLDDWLVEFKDGAEGKVEWDESRRRSGARSLKITKYNGKGYIDIYTATPLKCQKEQKIAFQGYYHTRNAACPTTLAMVRLTQKENDLKYNTSLDSKGLVTDQEALNCPPKMWMKRLVRDKLDKNDEVVVHIIACGNAHTIWWDDLALEDFSKANKRWWDSNPFSTEYAVPELVSEKEFKRRLANDIEHTAKMTTIKSRSVLLVDGKPTPLVIFKEPAISPYNYTGGLFDKNGIRLQVQIAPFAGLTIEDNPEPGKTGQNRRNEKGMWQGKNLFDFSTGLKLIDIAMRTSPDSMFIITLAISPYAEWVNENPDEAWLDENGRKAYGTGGHIHGFTDKLPEGNQWWGSYYSEIWQKDINSAIAQFLNELKKTGHSKRIIGFHFSGGHDGQFAPAGLDYSRPALTAFRKWLKEKYKSDENLQMAWHNNNVTLDTAEVPLKIPQEGILFDPSRHKDYVDYYSFFKYGIFQIQEKFADTCRKTLQKDIVIAHWCMGLYDGSYVAYTSVNELIDSKAIDIIVPQSTYHMRPPGWMWTVNQPMASYHLNGKALVLECDLRTYLKSRYDEIGKAKVGRAESFAMWQSINRKITGQMIAADMGYWYYDMNCGWYNNEEVFSEIRESFIKHTNIFQNMLIKTNTWHPDVAVIIDEESFYWTQIGWKQYIYPTVLAHHAQFRLFGNSGVPYDTFIMKDLLNHKELSDKYKVFVFLNPYKTDEKKNNLYKYLKSNKRCIVWTYAPAYITDRELSLESMRDTTGIKIDFDMGKHRQYVNAIKSVHPLGNGLKARLDLMGITYDSRFLGVIENYEYWSPPRFYAEDNSATTLAEYDDGKTAIAVKEFPTWTSVYVAAPGGISAELFNNIARKAGAYVCSEAGNDVFVNDRFISIHGVTPGFYTLNLPQKSSVRDSGNGKIIAEHINQFQTFIQAQTTYWFALEY